MLLLLLLRIGRSIAGLSWILTLLCPQGFQQIELGFPDIVKYASTLHKRDVPWDDYDTLVDAGAQIKGLVASQKLKILMLQPFKNIEGWPLESNERKAAFERADGWIRVMQAVGTDMIQVS